MSDPVRAAKAAKLRYVNDDEPGIRRVATAEPPTAADFRYYTPDGRLIRRKGEIARIRAIGIPPAWREVWVCPDEDGHIQATGRDARGRKQYRYHPRWREQREATKFERMLLFGQALPRIREAVSRDLGLPGLRREKVLAAVVALLGATFIRVGNAEYARDNESYGLTTLRDDHARINGSQVHFEFRGKSGVEHAVDLKDRRLAQIIRRSQELPGEALFQYRDDEGEPHAITSGDVNAYIRAISGEDFTAKDFRTWGGTTLAILALAERGAFSLESECKRNLTAMFKDVSSRLGNTVAVCRKYYVHPLVVEAYREGRLLDLVEAGTDASVERGEQAIVRLLGA